MNAQVVVPGWMLAASRDLQLLVNSLKPIPLGVLAPDNGDPADNPGFCCEVAPGDSHLKKFSSYHIFSAVGAPASCISSVFHS